ncbi:MAG: hypothetical protein HYT93_03245 [Parcubacteria group bacterium]|nr:hypothetical protein [Parcubacteria group bacterium]
MTKKMSPVVKNFGRTLRSIRRTSANFNKAMGFKNQVKNAHEALKGSVIKKVVGEEGPMGKTVRVICEDGMEFVAKSVSRPGIHYEWDTGTLVQVERRGARLDGPIIDE